MIHSLRERQTAISSTVVAGLGRGLLLKYNKTLLSEYGGPLELKKSWAHSVLQQMGFTNRRATSKSKLTVDNFGEVKEQYLIDICSVMKMENIPEPLFINWDQTAMKIVPSTSWTMEKCDTKRVQIAAVDDKCQITAVFACSLSGNFLPIQLIYEGTTLTKKCQISRWMASNTQSKSLE